MQGLPFQSNFISTYLWWWKNVSSSKWGYLHGLQRNWIHLQILQWTQVTQHMGGVSPSLKVQPGPSGVQHHPLGLSTTSVRPTEAQTCPAPQGISLCELFYLVVAGIWVKVVIPLFVVKLHQTPWLRRCMFATLNAVWAAGNKHQAVCSLMECVGAALNWQF